MDKDKENNIIIPTREEFEDFCSLKLGYNDREFTSELWKTCQKVGWRKKNGDPPKSWQILVICYNGIVLPKFGRKPYKRASVSEKSGEEEEFPDNGMHYIAYTDGSCDNNSFRKAGGSAYVLIKDGEVVRVKNHGQLNTTNNRMELLAIISAVNACPDGACVDVYTDSKYSILTLEKTYKPEEIVEKQRSYWQGGNKNELVVCVGIDKNKNVKWCNAFSWCDSPVVGVKSRDWFMSNPVNLEKYAEYIGPIVEKEWHRKNFEDFDYLTIELTDGQYWAIIILLLIFNIVMSSWIISNDYKNDL